MPNRKRDTQSVIAAAARHEFSEHGFAGARVARIASRAGVNKQLLFYYFGSKTGLFHAVVESARGEVATSLEDGGTQHHPSERLRAEVVRLFDALAGRPELVRLLVHHPQHPDTTVQRLVRELRGIVSEGQGLGFFRDDADPDLTARLALVLTLGYLGLEPAFGTNARTARPVWRDAAADFLVQSVSW